MPSQTSEQSMTELQKLSKKSPMQLDIVSPEGVLFSGKTIGVFLKSIEGELGILPGHLQLLTQVAPCSLRLIKPDSEEIILFISGGLLEVQPKIATLLADTALRPQDVNESSAKEAAENAKKLLGNKKISPKDFQQAQQELLEAMAKLQVIELMRARKKKSSI